MSLTSLLRESIPFLRREPGTTLLPPIDAALAASDSQLRRQLGAGWPKEWSGPDPGSVSADTDRGRLLMLYQAAFSCERGDIESYRAGLEKVVNASSRGAIQAGALRLLIKLLWVEVTNLRRPRAGEDSEEYNRLRGMLSAMCDRVDRDYAKSPWSDIVLFFSESARGIVSYYDDDRVSARLHLKRAEELRPRVEKAGDFGIEDCVGVSSLALGEMAVEDRAPDAARAWLLTAVGRLEGDVRAEAYSFLATSELDLGLLRQARRSAERGMRVKRASGSPRDGCDDSLECALAEALVRLGEYERAKGILRTLLRDAVIESKRQWAARMLDRIQEAGR